MRNNWYAALSIALAFVAGCSPRTSSPGTSPSAPNVATLPGPSPSVPNSSTGGTETVQPIQTTAPRQDACRDILIQNVSLSSLHTTQQYAWLRLITQDDYELRKQSIDTAASFITGYGPVSGEGKWSDFKTHRDAFLDSVKYSFNTEQSQSLYAANLSSDQVNAWKACMKSKEGVSLQVSHWSSKDVVVYFHFMPPPGTPQKYKLQVTPRHGKLAAGTLEPTPSISGESNQHWQFTRESPDTEFILTVSVGPGFSAEVALPVYVPVSPPPPPAIPNVPVDLVVSADTNDPRVYFSVSNARFLGHEIKSGSPNVIPIGNSTAHINVLDAAGSVVVYHLECDPGTTKLKLTVRANGGGVATYSVGGKSQSVSNTFGDIQEYTLPLP